MPGSVLGLAIREKPFAPMQTLPKGEVTRERGLEGDYRGAHQKNRKVTVLFGEDWAAACSDAVLDPALWTTRRANILVHGIENPRKVGARLRVGGALLEIYCECDPCSRMDRQHQGLTAALEPDWRGGVCCRVIEGGAVAVGDPVAREADGAGEREVTANPESVLDFWLNEVGPKGWYEQDDALDGAVRERFELTWREACDGLLEDWLDEPRNALAMMIVLDQFPRNMFRGTGRAFATDYKALKLARRAIDHGHDLKIAEPERQFFYLPFMHAEDIDDQDRCVDLISGRMGQERENENLYHAHVHRAVIERFGRFPYRNAALGRESTPEERAYIEAGRYEPDGWERPA